MTLDELRYYRNLLALEVGDEVEWCCKTSSHKHHRCSMLRGTTIAIYPEGKGQHIGMQHAFLVVFSTRGPPLNYSVALTNPTLKKLETDK